MSDLAGLDFLPDASTAPCNSCGMKKQDRKGCCHDEKKTVKSEKDQRSAEVFLSSLKAPVTLINTNCSVYSPVYLSRTIKEHPCSHAPPIRYKVPQYLYNCSFRI